MSDRYQVWTNPGYIEILPAGANSCLTKGFFVGGYSSVDEARRAAVHVVQSSDLRDDEKQRISAVIRGLRAADIHNDQGGVVVPMVAPVTVESPSLAASEFTQAVIQHVTSHPIWGALQDQVMNNALVMTAIAESAANNLASHYGERPKGLENAHIERMLVADFLLRGAVGFLRGGPNSGGFNDSQVMGFLLRQTQCHLADYRQRLEAHQRPAEEEPSLPGDELEEPTDDMRDWLLSRVGVELGVSLEDGP
jgi:hypothetical protein